MRLPRFLLAGVLLFLAILGISRLFAQPGFSHVALVAAGAFVPLWYAICVINTGIGVKSAGYPLSGELPVFVLNWGAPSVLAAVAVWRESAGDTFTEPIEGGRMTYYLLFAAALWAAIVLLAQLFLDEVPLGDAAGTAALVFAPLWLLVTVINLIIGVQAAGYGVVEELPVLAVLFVVPTLIAVGAWKALGRPSAAH